MGIFSFEAEGGTKLEKRFLLLNAGEARNTTFGVDAEHKRGERKSPAKPELNMPRIAGFHAPTFARRIPATARERPEVPGWKAASSGITFPLPNNGPIGKYTNQQNDDPIMLSRCF